LEGKESVVELSWEVKGRINGEVFFLDIRVG
jgi:hypothetical protein